MRCRSTSAFVLAFMMMAACGRIAFDDVTTLDARLPDDSIMTGCVAMAVGDDFADGVPCTPWGTTTMVASTVTEANGELVITPAPNMSGLGACTRSSTPAPESGLFAEIVEVLPFGVTGIFVDDALMPTGMFVSNNRLNVCADSSTIRTAPYDPVEMRWWRIRRSPELALYETSPDASRWTLFASAGIQITSPVAFQLSASQQTSVPAPGQARFGAVNVCP